jgi:hypothetical protein
MAANGSHPHTVADVDAFSNRLGTGLWSPDSTSLAFDLGGETDIVNGTTGGMESTIDALEGP